VPAQAQKLSKGMSSHGCIVKSELASKRARERGKSLTSSQALFPFSRLHPKRIPRLYTNSGQSKKNGRSRHLQGWAREGYLRFNMLYTLVEQDRLRCANFESELMLLWQTAVNKGKPTSQLANDDSPKDIFPANDLEGLTAPSANDLYSHDRAIVFYTITE
jgi:hypothetical protein